MSAVRVSALEKYTWSTANYCIGYGVYSNIYVEKCAFTSEKAKQNALKDWHGDKDFNIKIVDCLGIEDVELSQGDRGQFVPSYNYDAFDSNQVESVLKDPRNGAGATM